MTLIHHDAPQGTAEWHMARLGRVTSSGAQHVLPLSDLFPDEKGKKDNAKGRADYALRLACERVTGLPADESFTTVAMERGTALEPAARLHYAERHPEWPIHEVGFFAQEGRMVGDSPDGLVGTDVLAPVGGWEGKCPGPVTHWGYRQEGGIPRAYLRQMLHHLWTFPMVEWWDFTSWHPGLPGRHAWFEVRLWRTEAQPMLDIYEQAVVRFLRDVDALEDQLMNG